MQAIYYYDTYIYICLIIARRPVDLRGVSGQISRHYPTDLAHTRPNLSKHDSPIDERVYSYIYERIQTAWARLYYVCARSVEPYVRAHA